MDVLGGMLSGIGALMNAETGARASMFNTNMSRENFEWQKALQLNLMQREDTAVQRRVADLKAAGLSPVLAAGSAAGSGPIVQTEAPRMEPPKIDFSGIMDAILKGAQWDEVKAKTRLAEAGAKLTTQQEKKAKAETDIDIHDLGILTGQKAGLTSKDNGSLALILKMLQSQFAKDKSGLFDPDPIKKGTPGSKEMPFKKPKSLIELFNEWRKQ